MKTKFYLAAFLCAAVLISGCTEKSDHSVQNYSSSTQSSFSSSSESSESSSSTLSSSSSSSTASSSVVTTSSRSSQSSSSSSAPKKKVYSRIAVLINGDTSTSTNEWIFMTQLSDKGFVDGYFDDNMSLNDCDIYVYASDSPDKVGEVVQKKHIDKDAFRAFEYYLNISPWETTKYVRIQVVGDDFKSEYSNYYEIPPKKQSTVKKGTRYTHTFNVPSNVEIIPDYSDAEEAIERGETPDAFYIQVRYTCPGCDRLSIRNIIWGLPYTHDGQLPFNHKCGLSSCPYYKREVHFYIKSHATKAS